MKILFLGGPGNISESTIRYFLSKGHMVAVLKRSCGGVMGLENKIRLFLGDRRNETDLITCFHEFQPEIIVDCCCFEPWEARLCINAVKKCSCRRFIFVSTADVYGYPLSSLPMHEDDVWRETNSHYAEWKKQIEGIYKDAFSVGNPSLTIVRPSYSLGKTFALSSFERDRGKYLVTRLRQGRPIYSPGDGTTLIDANAAYNTGMMIARICEDDRTCGEDYNCAYNRAVTYDEYIWAFANVLGTQPHIIHIPTDFMLSLGRKEVENSLLKELSVFHLYFSSEKFHRTFPDYVWEYTLEDAIRDYIQYQELTGGFAGTEKLMFEDKVVDMWIKTMEELKKKVNQEIDTI